MITIFTHHLNGISHTVITYELIDFPSLTEKMLIAFFNISRSIFASRNSFRNLVFCLSRSVIFGLPFPGKPHHNGKVERSHLTDKREFYQLLNYTDDVDLNKKLNQWEDFYNFNRPHGAFQGRTPYEKLKCLLKK
jgi:hypothetical protein